MEVFALAYNIFENTKSSSSSKKKKSDVDDIFQKVSEYSRKNSVGSKGGGSGNAPTSATNKTNANAYNPSSYLRDFGSYVDNEDAKTPSNDYKGSMPSVSVGSDLYTAANVAAEREDPNWGRVALGTLLKGADEAATAISSTGAWLEGALLKPVGSLFGNEELYKDGLLYALDEKMKENKAINEEAFKQDFKNAGKVGEVLDNYGVATVAAVPQAIIALMSGGTSLAAQGTTQGLMAASTVAQGGLATTLSTALSTMAKNPSYWASFAQGAGQSYEQAKADGANDLTASAYAVLSNLANAAVEIGGGIEALPGQLQGAAKAGESGLRLWVKSMIDEGKEEVVQGMIGQLTQTVYGKNNELFSTTDSEAVINPYRAADEFLGGVVVGGILGGAQTGAVSLMNAAANSAYNKRMDKIGDDYAAAEQDVISEGLTFGEDTEAYRMARDLRDRADSGEQISRSDLGRAVVANQRAIQLERANMEQSSVEAEPVQTRTATLQSRLVERGMDQAKAEIVATSIDRILNGDTTVTGKDKDVLRVGNDAARSVFEEEAGVKLPVSNSSTRKTVSEYIAQTALKQQKQETAAAQTPVNVMSTEAVNQMKAAPFAVTTNSGEATLRQAAQRAADSARVRDAMVSQRDMASVGENGKRVYQKHIGNAKSVTEYSNAFQRYYDAGQIGMPFESIKTAYDGAADRSVLYEAYSAGVNDVSRNDNGNVSAEKKSPQKGKKTPSKGKGKLYDIRTSSGKSVDEKTASALKQIAKVFSIDIELRDSIVDSKGRSFSNGYYDRATGKIVLAADSDNPLMTVVKHEITHYLQQTTPKQYKALKDYVMKAYYENSPERMNFEIQRRIDLAHKNDVHLTRSGAMDEIVADATELFLTDRDSIDALVRENRSLAETILNAIRDVLRKIEAAMRGVKVEGKHSDFMNADQLKQAEKMWVDALASAAKGGEVGVNFAEVTESSAPVWSMKSMKFDLLDGQMQRDLVEHGIMTVEESQNLMDNISQLIDDMSLHAHILDMNEEYTKGNRPFNVYKPNSDPLYKVSLDFSTLCKKRLMTQFVMESLQTKLGKALSAKEQLAIRSKLEEYGKTNKQIQVACALCYVEARRLKAPDQINRFLDDRTTILTDYFGKKNKAYKQSVDDMATQMKVDMGYEADATLKSMKAADKKKVNEAKQKMMKQYVPTAEESKIIERANAIENKEFLSQAGLTNLSLNEPVIYDAFVTHVRNATKSKALESGVPYYYGDSKSVSDALIEAMNAENGLRHQSWSDFEIVHLLDNIAAVIELSVRKAKMHAYTKVPDFVRVNGNTGIMINLSLIPAGKNGIKDGKLDFSPTEGMDYQVAVDLREQYHKTTGTIAIGIDDQQIDMMLNDPTIDYVIPYHTSGMNAQLRKMAGISGWADYETFQNEKEKKGAKQGDCPDELWHKKPDFSEWFDTSKLDMSKSGVEIMKDAAARYLVLCEERGLTPKFSDTKKHTDFSKHDNYWKLLIDRKMVDKDGNIIIQQTVRPDFDFDTINDVVKAEVKNYDPTLLDYINDKISKEWENGGIKQREKELLAEEKKAKKAKKKAAKVANGLLEQVVAPEEAQKNTTDDGGNKYSYDNLVAKDPIKVVTVKERPVPVRGKKVDRGAVSAIALANANAQSDKLGNIQRYIHIPDIDSNVLLNKKGVEHGLLGNKTNSGTMATAEVSGDLVEILRNSIAVNQMNPRSDADGDFSYVLFGYAKNENGQEYIVKSTVNHFAESKSVVDSVEIYDVLKGSKAKKMESELMRSYSADAAAIPANGSDSNFTLSVADLLDVVKNNYPELLSKDVLSHFDISEDVQAAGMQFSFKDSDYLAAVESGDMETAQRMVDEAAKAAGYTMSVYHGTPNTNTEVNPKWNDAVLGIHKALLPDAPPLIPGSKEFYNFANLMHYRYGALKPDVKAKVPRNLLRVLRDGPVRNFTSFSRDRAGESTKTTDSKDGIFVTEDITFAASFMQSYEYDAFLDEVRKTSVGDGALYKLYLRPDETTEYRKTHYRYKGGKAKSVVEIVVKNPEQLKSADPVTYDDNGNVIPLSERFNPENNDIRFSLKDSAGNTLTEEQAEYFKDSKVRDENGNLKVVYHGTPTGGFTVFDKSKNGKRGTFLSSRLGTFFTEDKPYAQSMSRSNKETNPTVYEMYLNITKPLRVLTTEVWTEEDVLAIENQLSSGKYDGIIDELGNYVVFDSDQAKRTDNKNPTSDPDIRYQLKTPDEITDISKQIAEAEHKAKAVTDAEIMSQAVKDIAKTDAEKQTVRDYQRAMKALADYEKQLAVYEATKAEHGKGRSVYTDASGKVKKSGVKYSAAEKAEIQQKVNWWRNRLKEIEQRKAFKKILDREKADMAAAHAKKIADLRAAYDARLTDLRKKRDAKVEAEKQKMRDYKQHQRDSKEYKKLKGKLESEVKWLSERLLSPTEAKHVPDKFRGLVAKFLETLDFTTERMEKNAKNGNPSDKTIKLWAMIEEYQNIAKGEDSELVLTPIEQDLYDAIKETFEGGKRIENLTYEELEMVYDIVRYIKTGVAKANKAFNDDIKEDISEMGERLISEQRSKKGRKDYAGVVGGIDKLLHYDNVAPADKFHRYGGVMETLYGEIRKGFNTHVENVRYAIGYTQQLIEGHEADVKGWSGDKAKTTKFTISDGTTIELTPAQVMSLYALMKRDQAVGHVLGSGIVPSNVVVKEAKNFGKVKVDVAKKITAERASRCTIEDIQKIVETLSDDQKRIADGIVKLFTTKCADWGNETSMKLFDIRKFTEQHYFPIKSSDAYLNARFDDSGDVLIKNLGFTKNTVVNANNPIVIEDIFDVLTDHTNKMSMYNALVVPLTDFSRVFNYKSKDADGTINDSVQKALEASGGNLGIQYVKQFIRDVNKQANSLAAESFINQAISRYKKSKIAASARVLLQQPTAITRAAAMVDPKYIIEGLKQKANYEEMFENSPIAYWKSLGFYQTDMGRNMKDILLGNESKMDQLTMGIYGKADDFAWGHLWNAIKLEQADAHPEMDTSSSEFLEIVGERFDAVIDRTQVVDSVFHRSQIMRAPGAATKVATAFMAEATKSFNLLTTDLYDSINSKDYSKIKRTAVTYVANAVLVSAFAAIADMIRDDDDEDDEGNKRNLWDKYRDAVAGNVVDNINPLNMIPYAKEVSSIVQGYESNRMEMAAITEFVKTAKKWTQGKYATPYLLKETAEDFCELLGIPLKNAVRDILALARTAGDIVGGHYYADYMVDKLKYNISNSQNRSVFYKHYTDALLAGDQEAADAILADMVINGIPFDNIIAKGYQVEKNAAFSEAR